MGVYADRVLPWLCHQSMKSSELDPFRHHLAAEAEGRVLELGVGSGLNLPLYRGAELVVGIDPSARLLERAARAARAAPVRALLVRAVAEALPFADASFDVVISSFTLCTVSDVDASLRESRRVLAPGGRFAFADHGASSEPSVRRWQGRLTPIWARVAGGCHLDRPIARMLEGAGFKVDSLATGYGAGPKIASYFYQGTASPR